jgi:hypothetical protein
MAVRFPSESVFDLPRNTHTALTERLGILIEQDKVRKELAELP